MTTVRMKAGREDLQINMVLKTTEINTDEITGKVKNSLGR
jgi:hypothetical protein